MSALPNLDTAAANTAAGEQQPMSPGHAEEAARLEKLLQNRAGQKDLQDKGILKDTKLAPALQAAQAELQKHQLEDRLEGRLERRPEREELERRGILKDAAVAPALQGSKASLERSQLENKLGHEIAARPSPEELRAKGLLRDEDAAQ